MYIQETCIAGKTIEVRKYHTYRYRPPKGTRSPNTEETREAVQRINDRNAETKLRRLINTNFGEGDLHVVLGYRTENKPTNEEQMKRDLKAFIRRLRREQVKAGGDLRYVTVLEVGSRGARHIHMVVNQIPTAVLQRCWTAGRIHVNILDDTGQYGRLAAYLLKYTAAAVHDERNAIGKRWSGSRNLKKPIVKKKVVGSRTFSESVKPRAGYFIEKDSTRRGINGDGYPFLAYRMIRLE